MPLVTPTNITALDGLTPPSSADPLNFSSRGDAFLGAFPTLQGQINTVADETNTNAAWAQDQASTAVAQAASAAASANAASNSAIASNANAPKWTAGGVFAEGAVCWSPVDFQTYRKTTAGSSVTAEPTTAGSPWRVLTPVDHLANLTLGII